MRLWIPFALLVALAAGLRFLPGDSPVEGHESEKHQSGPVGAVTAEFEVTKQPNFAWPFEEDATVHVYQTYGQPEGHQGNYSIHPGVDLACAAGTPVFSPITGTIVTRYHGTMWNGIQRGVVIMPDEPKSMCVQLLHLDPATIAVGLGDYVQVGDFLGETVPFPPDGYAPHLHVSVGMPLPGTRSGPNSLDPSWVFFAMQNPLPLFDHALDLEAPTIVPFTPDAPLRLVGVEGNGSDGYQRLPGELSEISGLFDVDVGVFDIAKHGGPSRLVPFEVELEMIRVSDESRVLHRGLHLEWALNMNGVNSKSMFVDQVQAPGLDTKYIFHAMTMCPVDGSLSDQLDCEDSQPIDATSFEPGSYRLLATVRDVSGNEASVSQDIQLAGR